MKKLEKQQLHDLLLGAAIVGTGGGGSLDRGLEIVNDAFADGCEFLLADMDDIPDESVVGTPYGCGSIGPLCENIKEEYEKMEKIDTTAEVAAVRTIENYLGESLYGVMATELGGSNTAVAFEAGARLGKPVIDADPAGRSVPCLQHSTYYLNDLPIYPMAVANVLGDTFIINKATSDERAESLTRAAAVASYNHVGVVDHVAKWGTLKNNVLKNTLSMCLSVGEIARKAQEKGENYAKDVSEFLDGKVIFEGNIVDINWEDRDGFTFGDMNIEGKGSCEGDNLKIWFQNENIISWKNGEIFITVPDSINIVDNEKNMPLLNPFGEKGMEVTVFAIKAFEEWRSEKGLEVFGPKFFGYDIEYKKMEDIV
jgi:DUF917 family protein